jgi:predicted CoA-binding protein
VDPAAREHLIQECVEQRVWAVVGATVNREKYGYHVFAVLRDSGYTVYPVNPKYRAIDGTPCYPSVADLPERPAVVDLVVPASAGESIVRQCAAAGIERLWFQPGAESPTVIALAEQLGLKVVHDACAMVRRRRWPMAGQPA